MNRFLAMTISAVLTIGLLSGCANMTREDTGTLIGGVAGAAVGSTIGGGRGNTAAIVLGALAGSMIGSKIGKYMDQQDRMRAAQAFEYNRTGQTTSWKNPDTGNHYEVTPTKTYETDQGTPCREFTMDAQVGDRPQQVYGTACRQADGSWKIVK